MITPDELYLVCYGYEKQRNHIYVHAVRTGELVNKIPIKYAGFKEVLKIVALPDKASVVALIDVDKGNLMDIMQQKYLKSIPAWDGTCSKVGHQASSGKFELYHCLNADVGFYVF